MRAALAAAVALIAGATAAIVPVQEADAAGTLTGELRSVGPTILEPGGDLSASVTVRNGGSEAVEGIQLALSLTSEPLDSTDAMAAFLEDPSSAATTQVALAPEDEPEPDADTSASGTDADADADADADVTPTGETLEAGGATVMNIEVPADELGLPTGEWGVYGISLDLVSGTETVHVRTAVTTWVDAQPGNLNVAVLAVADGTPADVATTLESTALEGVAVAVDPTALTNATVFDHSLLEREVMRLPAGDPDMTSLAHGEGASLFDVATSQASGSTVLTTDKMGLVTPVPVLDQATLELAAQAGSIAAIALPGTVGSEDLTSSLSVAQDSTMPILSPDRVLSEIIAGAASDPVVDGALVAASALTEDDAVLVSLGTDGAVGPAGAHLVETLLATPWVTPVSVEDLAEQASAFDASVELPASRDVDNDLPADDVATLTQRLSSLATLSTVTERPDDALEEWGSGLVAGVPAAGRTSSVLRDAALTSALSGSEATLMGVTIAEGSDLNLLADSGDIPITVVNTLDRDATVTVSLVSNSPNLIVESAPEITVKAGQEATALVSVSAVSTANVTVVVGLETSDGEQIAPLQTFDIRVRADWGTAGATIFTALLVLLLIAGVLRTIRRGRSDTRLKPVPAPAEPLTDVSALQEADATGESGTPEKERNDV
ncbi:DUF6049 family protein [Demequina sp. NBRC 110057]|uniref:DUF6049 family protein n=1 Tax=Demequina sp. NBRC 110057 TaxID=1570346 RepID=UPI000A04CC2F|nr:DUF6049 family protein [Demequina sp. NBRC 110057]